MLDFSDLTDAELDEHIEWMQEIVRALRCEKLMRVLGL